MEVDHLEPYVGIAAALFVATAVVTLLNFVPTRPSLPATISTASSTLRVVSGLTFPQLVFPNIVTDSERATSSAAHQAIPIQDKKPSAPKTPSIASPLPSIVPTVETPPVVDAPLASAAQSLRGALVNILCATLPGSGLHSISGSGVIVDPKGYILTNAHVGQYFLLRNKGVSCVVRTGSPAANSYKADLVFISPEWLRANDDVLTKEMPKGTGEFDFAFLAVTKTATTTPLPYSFPYVPLAITPPTPGTPITVATYGAQFLEKDQIKTSLYPTIVFGAVKDVYTFGVRSIDVISLGGSPAAQEGSSGGGVADSSGSLVATITTSSVVGDVTSRTLHAITTSYIRREYEEESGTPLSLLLNQATSTAIATFALRKDNLERIITAGL